MEKKYTYCEVYPEGTYDTYYYIFDGEGIEKGDIVEIPFGPKDRIITGTVKTVEEYSAEDAPYPPEATKHIKEVCGRVSFDSNGCVDLPPSIQETAELDNFIEFFDLESVLNWALEHNDYLENDYVMEYVVKAYEFCVENDYRLDISALNLGALFYNGIAVPQDYVRAAQLYKLAADAGSIRALCNLGYCYYYGRHQEVDYHKAYECFVKGGLLGDENCLYKLGDMYMNGYYVEKNEKMAFDLYERADFLAEPYGEVSADIDMRLGKCYLYGNGTEKNLDEAMYLLTSALQEYYMRRKTDPFVKGPIEGCKNLISKCEEEMAKEFLAYRK